MKNRFILAALIGLMCVPTMNVNAEHNYDIFIDYENASKECISVWENEEAYDGYFQIDGITYRADDGCLVTDSKDNGIVIDENGKYIWNHEVYEEMFPVDAEKRDRSKLKADKDTKAFQLATEIEEKYGVQINYNEDAEFWKEYRGRFEYVDNEEHVYIALQELEKMIEMLPEDFFSDILKGTEISILNSDRTGNYSALASYKKPKEDGPRFHVAFLIHANEFPEETLIHKAIQSTFEHELFHLITYQINYPFVKNYEDSDKNMHMFTSVLRPLSPNGKFKQSRDLYEEMDGDEIYKYPSAYSATNPTEYIAELFMINRPDNDFINNQKSTLGEAAIQFDERYSYLFMGYTDEFYLDEMPEEESYAYDYLKEAVDDFVSPTTFSDGYALTENIKLIEEYFKTNEGPVYIKVTEVPLESPVTFNELQFGEKVKVHTWTSKKTIEIIKK